MRVRRWKLVLPLGAAVVVAATALVSTSLAASEAREVRVAIMSDCKGAFGANYENDIGGAQAAFAQYAGGKPTNKYKPSAGMTGIKVGGTSVKIVGYGCGDDTAPTAIKETRRLMEGLKADVMVGPLSGDEAVAIANYAKGKPTKTFVIGTAGSQDPTMQIAPKNMFRYLGDGAQWNAGLGEILYKKCRLAERRHHHGRLQLRLDVCGGHHCRLLRHRRQDHEACVPAAQHHRLRLLRPAASEARQG